MALSKKVKHRIRRNKELNRLRLRYKTKKPWALSFFRTLESSDGFGEVLYPIATSEITQPSDSNTIDLKFMFFPCCDQYAIRPAPEVQSS
jgi:hypothetical protein